MTAPQPLSPVLFVGAGPGAARHLTLGAYQALQAADVVIHDRLVGPEIMALIPAGTRRIDVGKLPKGLEIRGNALLVEQKLFPAQDWRFFAMDESGNYLKEILTVSHDAGAEDRALLDVHYFYGRPTRLESYRRTDLETIEYGFEVKLDKATNPDSTE